MSKQLHQGGLSATGILTYSASRILAAGLVLLLSACGGSDIGSNASQKMAQTRKTESSTSPSDYATVTQQLYIAYFGRPADAQGLAAFEAVLVKDSAPTDIQKLVTAYAGSPALEALVNSFSGSAEAQALYGGSTTQQFVTAIYQNVLGRAPDADGLTFWSNAIDSNKLSKGDAALSIMAGALVNTTPQGLQDATLVNNRIAVAGQFTTAVSDTAGIAGYSGNAAAQSARSMLGAVTADTDVQTFASSVNAIVTGLEQNQYFVNVSVTGLPANASLVLKNGSDSLTVSTNTSTHFPATLAAGGSYAVTATLPPATECDVAGATGAVGSSVATNVVVSCRNIHLYLVGTSNFIYQYSLQPDYSLTPMDVPTISAPGRSGVTLYGTGQYVYQAAANASYDYTLYEYKFDSAWNMVPVGSIGLGNGLTVAGIAMDPQSRYVYVNTWSPYTILQYTIAADGSLVPMQPASVPLPTTANGPTIDGSGKYLYASMYESGTALFSIGPTGALTQLGNATSDWPGGYTAGPSGKYLYSAGLEPESVVQYPIKSDGTLGTGTTVSAPYQGETVLDLFVDPTETHLYAVPMDGQDMEAQIDQFSVAHGPVSLVPSAVDLPLTGGAPTSIQAANMDPTGRYLFVVAVTYTADKSSVTGRILYEYAIGSNGTLSLLTTMSLAAAVEDTTAILVR